MILFAVGGVGLGNSTRCHAVIQRMPGSRAAVLGYGNSASYFRSRGYAVHALIPLHLAKSFPGYVLTLPLNLAIWAINSFLSLFAILRLRPDVVVVDSEYSAILPALLTGRRLVSINHAAAVRAQWRRYRRLDLAPSYFCRELPDAWLSGLCDRVIVPTFDKDLALGPRFLVVPPIVRELPPPARSKQGILILRGGSAHLAPLQVPPGRCIQEIGGGRIVEDALTRIAAAEVVVCQGGLSSLSEVLALGARAIVVPLSGHAEQSLNARWLADQRNVILAEDGDLSAAMARLDDFQPNLEDLRFDGAARAALELTRIAAAGAKPAARPWLEWWTTWMWLAVLLLGLGLDAFLLSHQLIKMEEGNATQLGYHALIRDGIVMLSAPVGSATDALYHWFFHLILLFTPRLERVAVVLNAVYYLAIFGLFVGIKRRLGPVAAAVSGGLMIASPVSFILSKHVISTSLVPLVGIFYCLRHLDFAKSGDRSALGDCFLALGTLIALNHGHAWIGLALLYEMRRLRSWRVPAWALAGAALVMSTGLLGAIWGVETVGWAPVREAFIPSFSYPNAWDFARRAIFGEYRVNEHLPYFNALLALCAWGFCSLGKKASAAPAGLVSLLAVVLPMALVNHEAIIFWQTPFFILMGWAAANSPRFAILASTHALLAMTSFCWLFAGHLQELGFFVASSVGTRYRVLRVLSEDMGMRSAEFETLRVSHKEKDGNAPALLPGLSYYVDRVLPPLPPGGQRCFSVSDADEPLPAGTIPVQRIERYGLIFKSWRGEPCRGNARPLIPPVLGFDLRRGLARTIHFDPAPTPDGPRP